MEKIPMLSKFSEEVIETKICKHCNKEFYITDLDIELLEKISPIFPKTVITSETKQSSNSGSPHFVRDDNRIDLGNGKVKYLIPSGDLCSECKEQRKLAFRNERKLYKRKCDFSGKEMVSIYSPDKKVKVYDQNIWWSDKWDALDYGIKFDFSKNFFEQFKELFDNTPKISIFNKSCENSPYSHFESDHKNCYMTVGGHWSENCAYMTYGIKSKNTYDVFWAFECENCYEIINSYNLNKCKYLEYSKNCFDCFFGLNLEGCQECIGCVGLNNKKYFILNREYSKDDYLIKKEELNLTNKINIEEFKIEFEKLKLKIPHRAMNIFNSENAIGNDIFGSKNIVNGFLVDDCENCKNISVAGWAKDSKDSYAFGALEKAYEFISGGLNSYNIAFMSLCYECNNSYYCIECHNSSNLFGCVGLKNKSYCILNKQYEKSEYEKLVPKIIEHMQNTGEWGEFFPSSLSPFGYNETVAMDYFPLTREEVICHSELDSESLKNKSLNQEKYPEINPPAPLSLPPLPKGDGGGLIHGPIFNRSDYKPPKPKVDKVILANKLPEDIKEIPDDILNWAIMPDDDIVGSDCNRSLQKPFRIIKEELEFYRKHNLQIPRRHPDQRHLDRMNLRNPRKLYDRLCDCEKCEENNKKAGTFKQEEFALKDSPIKLRTGFEVNSGGQRRKIKTTYSKDRKEIVYCEECYRKEVY